MLGFKHICTILTGKHQATTNSVLDFSVVYRGRKGQVEKLRHSVSEAEQDPNSPTRSPACSSCVCDPRIIFVLLSYTECLWPKTHFNQRWEELPPQPILSQGTEPLCAERFSRQGRYRKSWHWWWACTAGSWSHHHLPLSLSQQSLCGDKKQWRWAVRLQGPFHPSNTCQEFLMEYSCQRISWRSVTSSCEHKPVLPRISGSLYTSCKFIAKNRNTPGTGSTQPATQNTPLVLRLKTQVSLCQYKQAAEGFRGT